MTCQTCGTQNRLTDARVSEPSAQQTIYSCIKGCPEPILSVEGTGYRSFGRLDTEFPASDEWTFADPFAAKPTRGHLDQ